MQYAVVFSCGEMLLYILKAIGLTLGKLGTSAKYHYREMAWLPFQKSGIYIIFIIPMLHSLTALRVRGSNTRGIKKNVKMYVLC